MAHYRIVDVRIWTDAKFSALSDRAKLAFLYCLTHPNLTVIGAMRATIPGLCGELAGISEGFGEASPEAFREAFEHVFAKGLAIRDERAPLVWLPRFLRYNPPQSPNVVRSWAKAFDLLPECAMKDDIYQHLKAFAKGLPEGFSKAFDQAFAKVWPNQDQDQEQDLRSSQPSVAAGARGPEAGMAGNRKSGSDREPEPSRMLARRLPERVSQDFERIILEACPHCHAPTVWGKFLRWLASDDAPSVVQHVESVLRTFAAREVVDDQQRQRAKTAERSRPAPPGIAKLAAGKRVTS